jgi:hypothetical protein
VTVIKTITFEKGDFSECATDVDAGNLLEIVTSPTQTGRYSAHGIVYPATPFHARLEQFTWPTTYSELHARSYNWFKTTPTVLPGSYEVIVLDAFLGPGTPVAGLWVVNDAGIIKWDYGYSDFGGYHDIISSVIVPTDRWILVEVMAKIDAVVGEVRFRIDDVEIASVLGLNNDVYVDKIMYIGLGPTSANCSAIAEAYMDNAVISTSYIGPQTYVRSTAAHSGI